MLRPVLVAMVFEFVVGDPHDVDDGRLGNGRATESQ